MCISLMSNNVSLSSSFRIDDFTSRHFYFFVNISGRYVHVTLFSIGSIDNFCPILTAIFGEIIPFFETFV